AQPYSGGGRKARSASGSRNNPYRVQGARGGAASSATTHMIGASPLTRLVARLLEGLLLIGALLPGTVMTRLGRDIPGDVALRMTGTGLVLAALVSFLVFDLILFCEGKSVGKKMLGLTVYDRATGLPAGFLKTFMRELLPNLINCIPIAGAIVSFVDLLFIFSSDHRRLVDRTLDTVVLAD
ncbi:MAG: hypothetical protein RLZZ436_3685, partial [Planctomycetota bacterium]